jgi:hypothetical protein
MSQSSRPASRASCRPDLLDRFVSASRSACEDLRVSNDQLATAWSAAQRGCPGLIAPPSAQVLGLHSAAFRDDGFVRGVAKAFREAGMQRLLSAWSAVGSFGYALASLAGARIPAQRPDWTILRFETADRGRLVEVRGDLTTATHIVVMVPGMTNELANVDTNFRPRSDRLYEELVARSGPSDSVAVVMWLGYRNPTAFPEAPLAATSGMARRGADALNQDLAAIKATGTNAMVTVVAHSYGTVVAGEALDRGMPADRVVVVGSPGMNAPSRSALGSPNVELFASSVGTTASKPVAAVRVLGRAANVVNPVGHIGVDVATGRDWAAATSVVGAHGADPADPSFGATPFNSDGSGHGAYFNERSLALTNLALIGLGRQPVRRQDDAPPRKRSAEMKAATPYASKAAR